MKEILNKVTTIIDKKLESEKTLVVAIDGRCGAGKTTLALQLQENYNCNVIHIDHFFLRPEQRTKERLQTAGENVDHERFLEEVLMPLKEGKMFSYRPFDCQQQQLAEAIVIEPTPLTVIEGSYCCHKNLWAYYDLRLFLTVEPKEQICRIKKREGIEKVEMFSKRWIPMEENYFSTFQIEERCDYCFFI